MIPSIGRVVLYRLTAADVTMIFSQRRASGGHGNPVTAGDVFPMLITRVWAEKPTEGTAVQGQVFLDGDDQLWVTSVQQGDGERQWSAPRKVGE